MRGAARGALLRNAGIGLYAVATGACAVTIQGWQASDTYFAASGLALFVLGLFIVRRQSQLQAALADLEVEEKITVLLAHAAALLDDDKSYVGFNVVGDAIACMKVLAFTTDETRSHYAQAACAALDELGRATRDRSPFTPEEIDRLVTTTRRIMTLIDGLPAGVQRQIAAVRQSADRLLIDLRHEQARTTADRVGAPISIANFTAVLRDHVRVRLDFSRLNDVDFRARARVINEPLSLVGWVSPWYADADGNECDYRVAGATPTPLVGPDGSAISPPPSHAETIASIADSMRNDRPGPILVGCYQPFGHDTVVVIDGNHRLRALLFNGGPLHVVALILHGPNDPTILSDLTALEALPAAATKPKAPTQPSSSSARTHKAP